MAVICLFLSNSLLSQVTTYEKYIGESSHEDFFNDTEATPDGGYVAVGQTQISGNQGDIYLVKFSIDGIVEFAENLGSFRNEFAHSVAVMDDRYIIGGSTFMGGAGTNDCYLLAVGLDGNLLEEVIFGGDGEDIIYALTVLDNGNIAVASTIENESTGADINVRIYDQSLNIIAETTYPSENLEVPHFITEVISTGDILVSGYQNFPEKDGILISFSNDLSTINWEIISNDAAEEQDEFFSGVHLNSDEYLFVSKSNLDDVTLNWVNVNTGIISNTVPIYNSFFPGEIDMAKIGDTAYILDSGNNRILYYDILNDFLSVNETLPFAAVALTNHINAIGLAGKNINENYIVAEMRQYNNLNYSEEWSEMVGDFTPENISFGFAISEADDGGMYLAGIVDYNDQDAGVYVRKVNLSGETIWSVILDEPFLEDETWAITTATDGGCVVVYTNISNLSTLQKISSDGDLEWSQEVGNGESQFSVFGNIVTTSNGDYFYVYTTNSNGTRKAEVAHVSQSGSIIWEKDYQIDGLGTRGYNIEVTADGDILVACQIETPTGEPGMLRINSDGDVLWANVYVINTAFSRFTTVKEAADGTIYAAGLVSTFENFGGGPGNIFHLDAAGNVISGGLLNNNEYGKSIYDLVLKADGSVHTLNIDNNYPPDNAIYTTARVRTIEIHEHDEDFAVINNQSFGSGSSPIMYRLLAHSDGGLAAYGYATLNNNFFEYLIRIDAEGASSVIEIKPQGTMNLLPTASDGNFTIDFQSPHTGELMVKIYNPYGQIVQELTDLKQGEKWQKSIDLVSLEAGNYFVNIRLNGFSWTQQIVKQ